jgi:hypothetical protein
LPVWIENHTFALIIDEAGRQAMPQLAPASLIENPASQTRPQHMKLRFTHRSFQPKQQPVIEICWIIETVLIEN